MTAQTGWKQEPDDQSERLYSLTLALVQTEVGLTKDEIFMSIRGYRLDLERAGGFHGDLVALNKKFDRDKEKLRELGVQIVPAANSSEGDSDYRYRISREIFEWPEGTTISSKQLQLLELAASLWDRAALSPEATNAITRLRAIADIGDASISQGIAPRISTVEPSFSPLKKAIEERVQVSFSYRRADGQEAIRTVEPWQLAHINGLWMLLGLDVERGAPRNFLLKRIHSKVGRSKQVITEPTPEQIANAKSELAEVFKANVAKIQVRPGTCSNALRNAQPS
jgi:proteasome accessory factor B